MRIRTKHGLLPFLYFFVAGLIVAGEGCGGGSSTTAPVSGVAPQSTSGDVHLTAGEVQTIVDQARAQAEAVGLPVTISVLDHEGLVLAVFQMNGANPNTTISGGGQGGLEGAVVPASAAAISKGGTGAFFGTQGNAFTTRTAGFIIQEHFPPQQSPSPGGPLFGVQFSSLSCSDVPRPGHFDPLGANPRAKNLPLGLSADPGGLPLYKNGTAAGGIGVEGDGLYTIDQGLADLAATLEEIIAAAGTKGFSAPTGIQGTNILVDGVRFLFANASPPASLPPPSGGGAYLPGFTPIDSPADSAFKPFSINGIPGFTDRDGTYDPGTVDSSDGGLTKSDVLQIVLQAATQAQATRAAIRVPLGSQARVSIAVVDTNGKILGLFRTLDAPIFGYDVSVQKARTANFFSQSQAATELNNDMQGSFVTAAAGDGILLNGSVAFSDTAVGFLSQPIYPPGAFQSFELATNGPFSLPLGAWSVFNTGLQLNLIMNNLFTQGKCTNISRIANGIQIFSGSFPLYKNGVLVGGIGISGDGIDQDNIIGFMGSFGYEAPVNIRSDRLVVRGTPLPFSVFPRHPNL